LPESRKIEKWNLQFKEAALKHGGVCVGLAIGIRAVDIIQREFDVSSDTKSLRIRVGTKECLADAFKILLRVENQQLEYVNPRDNVISVRNGTNAIELHLTSNKITDVSHVFQQPEDTLFPIVRKLRINS